ncbi:hypothetical protein AB9Q10_16320 [Streptomyces krungchingensis]|uniref:hypothetical protein n=1 Tax=Streptomyces krungchingensis TaxID=1565034 RepID=UPI003CF20FCF
MTNSDKLLERIIKRVNDGADRFDITLTVGGALITGRLTPRAAWLESNIAVLNDVESMKLFADEFAAEGGSLDNEEYLHLTEAKTVFGVEIPIPTGAGFLRIPAVSVDAWSIGRVSIDRRGQ